VAEGGGRLLTVQGKALALFAVAGEIFAIDAECPHEGGPLQDGRIENGCVVCPWHEYQFELAGGRCLTAPGLAVTRYPTSVEDGTIWVEI
jgi:nitrite reductase (NADH) small subunit